MLLSEVGGGGGGVGEVEERSELVQTQALDIKKVVYTWRNHGDKATHVMVSCGTDLGPW